MLLKLLFSRTLSLSAMLLLAGVLLCSAQNDKLQLKGKVLDQNKAAVPGAKVTASTKGRNANTTTTTDQNGEFSLAVEPGDYTIKVLANGFLESSKAVTAQSGNAEAVEIMLEVAGSSATVNVVDASNYQTQTTISATKTITPLRDVPQSVSVVTKEQIKDQLMSGIGDVVRYMPGITYHQGENNRDDVVIRGNRSSADFFLNGVRDDVQYYRDLYNLDRVETMKGPNAMIFGRGGGGGVINRVSKEAIFSPIRELTFQAGSFENRRIAGDIDQPFNDKVAFRLNGMYENSGSYRKFIDLERGAINPTFTFTSGKNTRFTIGYEYLLDKRTADRGITSFQGLPAHVPIKTFYGNPGDSKVRAEVNILTGTFDHQIGNLFIHNRTLYGDYDRFYANYVPGAVNAAKTLVTLTTYDNATHRKNFFNQTDLTYIVNTGSIKHTIIGGVELGNQRTRNFRNTGFFNNTATSVQAPFDNPTISIPVTYRQSATDANNHLKLNLAAGYIQDQVEINKYVQVIVGARYDYFDLTYFNNRNTDIINRQDNLLSPRVGLVIKPVTELSIYGSYSISYLPSAGDQFASLTTITQQVKPEKFTNYEFGLKWDIRRNMSLTSALYRLDRTNTRSTDPNDPTRIIQTGSQRTNGFEIGLNGSILPKWSMSGGYAYQDAFISSATTAAVAGKQVGQVPHHTFSLWNKYQIISRLGVGLGIISRTDMFAAVDNTVTLPGYTRADVAIFYSFNEHWRLQANVENLFDKKYYLNADSNTNISPGSPRALKVGLNMRF